MGEVLIKAENVSKKFAKDFKRSLYYGVKDVFSKVSGGERKKELRKTEFWAVKDVSFEVKRGECLGLIGHNGAGKSTLLKMLNGLIAPDEGSITMRGKIGALIELGAGFNPILTGRENIYNNASVLGFTKEEVNKKFDSIVEFSEIGEFLDMPVQNYSSGMKVRLGFAVAAQMEPDILLIDEVLAVGDMGFVLKCFKRIDEILPHTAVIFVSHSMPMVSRICTQITLMNKGVIQYYGVDVGKGIDSYYQHFSAGENAYEVYSNQTLKFISASVKDRNIEGGNFIIGWNEDVEMIFNLQVLQPLLSPLCSIAIYNQEQRGIAESKTTISLDIEDEQYFKNDTLIIKMSTKKLSLSKGIYSITLNISDKKSSSPILKINNALNIQVTNAAQTWTSYLLDIDTVISKSKI
ncbi:MAG: ATP-binding cassette domain-containing protein [Chitinophagaceae bacterium]|nr:ATP-binding cassette domain-containing protein [Chitinophagaceae bacterium]MCW5905648.1 ATP-binding cassette domain-containing protein [Chitinophagaceae bacterium]